MSMSQSVLTTELNNLDLYYTEADAIEAWAGAFRGYFSNAESNSIPINADALGTPELAMKNAMSGLSTSGANAIQSGIVAFWNALVSSPPSYFTAAIAIIPPPTLGSIGSALQTVFDTNISTSASKEDAMEAIAGVLHTNNLGGTATFPGSPPPSFPIL